MRRSRALTASSTFLLLLTVLLLFAGGGVATAQEPTPAAEEPGILVAAGAFTAPQNVNDVLAGGAFAGGPAYDSGWIPLAPDTNRVLRHNLGGSTDNYVVIMDYQANDSNGVNQRFYGGADFGTKPAPGANAEDRVGAYWRSLSKSSVTVYRRPEDIYAEAVRVRIWVDPSPDYDSGWRSLTPAASATTLTHNLGGNADDYVVDMQYRSGSSGVNQRYFGGADFGSKAFSGSRTNDRVGLYWRSLTSSSITLFRRAEDDYAASVRVRIWRRPTPTYDSGWVSISQNQAKTLAHNIGGNPDDYVVDMQYRSGSSGVNQRYFGGADFGAQPAPGASANDREGAYWRSLSKSSVTVYCRPDDIYANEVRIRIWRMARPGYDSGWRTHNQNQARTFTHGVGGNPENYLMAVWQYDTSGNGINQRHFGGADFGVNPPGGYAENDRVGAYWRSLTSDEVVTYRRPEDGFADSVRIRIWDYNQRIYVPTVEK